MTFTHGLSTNNYGESKFIVSASPANGTHTTISAALAVASSGDTIFIRDGSYTEDLTMVPGVRLTAYKGNPLFEVTIIGKMTFSAAGDYYFENVTVQTNGDFCIDLIGANAIGVFTKNCFFNGTDNTIINYTNANAGSTIACNLCTFSINIPGITVFTKTGMGNISFDNSTLANNGASVVASTTTTASLGLNYCVIGIPIALSGTADISSSFCTYNVIAINTTAIALSGTSSGFVYNSFIGSGTASAVTIGAGSSIQLDGCEINSSNANVITGAGTLERGDLTFISGSTINPTTNTQLPRLPKVSPTLQVFTAGVAATYTTPTNTQWIRIRLVGAGGGGAGSGTGGAAGGTGATTTFSGGALSGGGGTGSAGAAATGGAASGGNVANINGGSGNPRPNNLATTFGGNGGSSYFGGAGFGGDNAPSAGGAGTTNSGSGGGGGGCGATLPAGNGGGAGGYVEHIINIPAPTYTYTVGVAGTAGAAGVGGVAGGAGGSGLIIVEEYYL